MLLDNQTIDRQKLTWALPDYPAESSPVGSSSITIGESSANGVVSLSLETNGHEANRMEIQLRVLRLKEIAFSILVAQNAGFESVAENYELSIVENKRLKRAFQFSANMAMQQTSTFKIEDVNHDGFDNIIIMEEWNIADLEMGPGTKRFKIYPPTQNVSYYAVILAAAPKIDAMLKRQADLEQQHDCLKYQTLILSTTKYQKLTPNLYFLGDIQLNKEDAVHQLKKFKSCTGIRDAYIKRAK